MNSDLIGYNKLMSKAMVNVIIDVLSFIKDSNHIPGEHHLYITFSTKKEDVIIPAKLKEKFPDKMTIVLQHQFQDLEIKENHFSVNETFETLLKKIKAKNLINSIQIEVENLNQLKIALKYSVKNILLDNFSHSNIKKAIGMANKNTIFEISGNVNQKTVLKIAELGKLRISIGSLTKNIQAIDFSMLIEDKKSHAT